MFEQRSFKRPGCNAESRERLDDRGLFVCRICGGRFKVLLDEATGKVALIEETRRELPEPLFLPPGVVRFLLIAAFALCSAVLWARGKLKQPEYLEFVVILLGLVAGLIIGKAVEKMAATHVRLAFDHVKGVAVIIVGGYLTFLFMSGAHQAFAGESALTPILLCAVISFYYGSRA